MVQVQNNTNMNQNYGTRESSIWIFTGTQKC